jgi:hypothetical protein
MDNRAFKRSLAPEHSASRKEEGVGMNRLVKESW